MSRSTEAPLFDRLNRRQQFAMALPLFPGDAPQQNHTKVERRVKVAHRRMDVQTILTLSIEPGAEPNLDILFWTVTVCLGHKNDWSPEAVEMSTVYRQYAERRLNGLLYHRGQGETGKQDRGNLVMWHRNCSSEERYYVQEGHQVALDAYRLKLVEDLKREDLAEAKQGNEPGDDRNGEDLN